IEAQTDKEVAQIIAEANKEAEILKGVKVFLWNSYFNFRLNLYFQVRLYNRTVSGRNY
ncbi:unnamed protein product, partial [marine sediment metagenome]